MKNTALKYYPFIPLLMLCGFYLFKVIAFPVNDFSNYYFGGKFLAEGHFNSDIYFPYQFNKAILDSGNLGIFASYAPNTPFLALFFLPFSLVSALTAKMVFNCISIGLLLSSIYRLFSFYKINPKWALLIPLLFFVPIKNNLLFGQVYFLLFFLLTEGWLAYEKENWKVMAFFWGLAIVLKVFPILVVAHLLFRRQWKPFFFLVACCCLLIGISLLFTGIDIWLFYLKDVLPKASNGEIATAFVPNYQSVFMFLKELLVFDATDNPEVIFDLPVLFAALIIAFKIGILTLGYFVSNKVANSVYAFTYWILAMILLSPYGSTYTFILLLFPFLALFQTEISNVKKVIFCVILFLICNLPLSFFIENRFPFSYLRLFFLMLLFVLFLIQLRQKINWKIVGVFYVTPIILLLIFKKEEIVKSTMLFKDGSILIYDYTIQTNNETKNYSLVSHLWDGKEKVLFCKQNIQKFQPLNLKNNQVFYHNQQLTFDKSNKLKPMLIDNKFILYLSDYDRGIGFYTLRKIELH